VFHLDRITSGKHGTLFTCALIKVQNDNIVSRSHTSSSPHAHVRYFCVFFLPEMFSVTEFFRYAAVTRGAKMVGMDTFCCQMLVLFSNDPGH